MNHPFMTCNEAALFTLRFFLTCGRVRRSIIGPFERQRSALSCVRSLFVHLPTNVASKATPCSGKASRLFYAHDDNLKALSPLTPMLLQRAPHHFDRLVTNTTKCCTTLEIPGRWVGSSFRESEIQVENSGKCNLIFRNPRKVVI